jgi:hypothetical protein
VPGSSVPSVPTNVQRGQARARGRRAGDAPGLLRGPQAGGRWVPAAGRGGGCAQDPAQERRHEGGDAAGRLRNCPHRKNLWLSLRLLPAIDSPLLTGCSL